MQYSFPTFRRLLDSAPGLGLFWRRRATWSQRLALLRLIAVSTEERLPLGPLLDAWSGDQHGEQRRRVLRLSYLLKEGTSLPDAVEQVPGVLRDEDVLTIRFGAQSGTLTASLRESIEELSAPSEAVGATFRSTLLYGGFVCCLFFLISLFNYIKIVPAINQILQELEVTQPQPLAWSIRFASAVEQFWWVGALALLALIWSAFSARPGRFVRDAILGRLFGAMRELHTADVLQKLSAATKAGRPISGALSTLARYHFDPQIRHKLLFARNELEQGADEWQAMAAAGLLTPPEVRLLTISDRVGNRPWTLKHLAAVKRRRTRRWLGRLSDLSLPALAMVLGAFVLFQGLALFVPLVEIVTHHL